MPERILSKKITSTDFDFAIAFAPYHKDMIESNKIFEKET